VKPATIEKGANNETASVARPAANAWCLPESESISGCAICAACRFVDRSSRDVVRSFCYLFVMRFDVPALGQWALLIIAFAIIVMIVLGVSTTKLWFWDLLSS
jgi:hypothetical protein